MKYWIHDKRGRRYLALSSDENPPPCRLSAYRQTWFGGLKPVGYVNLHWEEAGALELCDIVIEPRYRNRGLGSALLRQSIALARGHGIQHIKGRIVRKDTRDTPHLLDWYRSHGFAVEEVAAEDSINQRDRPHSLHLEQAREQMNPGSTRGKDTQTVYRIALRLTDDPAGV